MLGAVFIKQRRIDFGGQQQPIGLDAGIVNSVQGMESHIQNIFEFLRIEDDVIHLCTVGGSERQGITLENEELTVSSGRGKPINNASRGIRSQRVGRERVAVHAIGSDGNDDLIQVGVERRRIGEFLRTSGIVDLIEHLRAFLVHDGHVLGVEFREVVGVGQRHDVQRIRKAAHEVLLSGRFLGRIVHAGIDDEMLRLLVGPQCRGVLGP